MFCKSIIIFIVMSDILSPVSKFNDKVHFSTNLSPTVANRNNVDTTAIELTLHLSSKFLYCLYTAKAETNLTYIQVVNSQLSVFQLKQCQRLESRLRSACCNVLSLYKSVYSGGAKRQTFNVKEHSIAIFKHELFDVKSLSCKLLQFDQEKAYLEGKCKDLYMALLLEQKKNESLVQCESEVEYLTSRNECLSNYIESLDKNQYLNSGKKYDECQPRQKLRKVKILENYVEKALAFADTFGITPLKLSCVSEGGNSVVLNLDHPDSIDNCSYQNLSADEKDKIKQIVFLCDKFCISDAAYHELSMYFNDMPRKYIVVQCRENLSSIFHLERLPGNVPGAMINLNAEVERVIADFISKNGHEQKKFYVKFSGDGARVSRISNYVIFSIQIVSDNCSLSYNDLHTVAIVNCAETYDNLKATCQPIFTQLNELAQNKTMLIGDINVDLEIFVCGDMKFLQILLGLCGATGNFACPWCKVHKHDRHDVSKPWDFYHSSDMFRSYDQLCFLSGQSKNTYGVKSIPLIKVDIDHIIPDELHLMLRVTDVLLRNLIDDAKDKDDFAKSSGNAHEGNVTTLVTVIQSCGVSFKIWTTKGTNELEWTSLSGSEKVKLLKSLPVKLLESNAIHFDTKEIVVKLWQDFLSLYSFILSQDCETYTGEQIFCKVKAWLEIFLSLGQQRKGYLKVNVTPYLHCLVYHVPFFMFMYGSLKKFSNQGVEKNNDVVKMIHQRRSSKWDGPTDALKVRKRLELSSVENVSRQKRVYDKKSEYWESAISSTRQAKRKQIETEIFEANVVEESCEIDLENMSDSEMRDFIYKKQGKKTKLRNRQKLIDLLKSLL